MKKNLYFIPRNTWFYTTFLKFSVYARSCITLLGLCLLVFLWAFSSYRIFSKMQSDYLVNLYNLQDQKGKLEEAREQTQQLQVSIKNKKHDLNTLIDSSVVLDSYMQKLLYILQQNSLVLQAYAPQSKHAKQWYVKHTARIDFSGSYDNVLAFIDTIKTLKLPLVCSYLHLEKQQEEMLASCHVSWYDFSRDEYENNK